MVDITVSLTDTEFKSLEYAAASVQDWSDNALKNRARIAKEQIITKIQDIELAIHQFAASNSRNALNGANATPSKKLCIPSKKPVQVISLSFMIAKI